MDAGHSVVRKRGHGLGPHVVADAVVLGPHQAQHHVGAHAAEADHAQLHGERLPRDRLLGDLPSSGSWLTRSITSNCALATCRRARSSTPQPSAGVSPTTGRTMPRSTVPGSMAVSM